MATRSRRSAATEVIEEEEEQEGLKKLRFKQSLVGKPGRQVSVGDLLTRLKALCEELRGLEQEEADRESLEPVAKELAHQSLLQHKDGGVRAWTACCLVDIFRLCAPDAPYTATQLKDIFHLIVNKIIPALADPSHTYNGQHMYVLRSLAEVKSVVLLTDIPSSNSLTTTLFTTCFDILSGPSKAQNGEELSKNVEHHMTQILSILIDESPSLSAEVVDVIVAQFFWADPITLSGGKGKKTALVDNKQSTLLRKEAPPAYNMAKNICNACPQKMARHISTYFSSVIVDFTSTRSKPAKPRTHHRASSAADEPDDEGIQGPSEEDLNDASKAHRLLRELWRCAPGVLQDIVPHLQEELGAENVQLRQLATETFGDMISGIGAAGPPPLPEMNPSAYPSQSLIPSGTSRAYNYLTTPTSPNSFPSLYPAAYQSFLQRKHDKSPLIRAAWTSGVARILMTSAGGVGLDPDEEQKLLKSFAESLIDSDERVRLAAVRAVEHFDFNDIIYKIGTNGGMSEPGSILSNLADRVKDKKNVIHSESMKLLGKLWGVAAGAIAEGNERVTNLLGPIPTRILDACYVNDAEINLQIDITLFESLIPLGYPPMKPRAAINANSHSQVVKESQQNGEQGYTEAELDKIRVERQLVLVRSLEEKAKKAFFAKQGNQAQGAVFIEAFLKLCEEYNGGVMSKSDKDTKAKLEQLITFYAKTFPDPTRASDDLWKFAKAHDRRSYQLIRFCMAPESDYRKVFKSIKELRKRIEDSPAGSALMETLNQVLYRVSLLCYNKSHVPAIIEYSRTDEKGLGTAAHEVLMEISTKHPKVFSTHVKDLCKALEAEAPSATTANPPGAVQDLKACASFAKKFPNDLPLNAKDSRKLIQSFLNFALYGTPPKAAKHAITIIMNSDNKKEMHAKEILAKSTETFEYGQPHYLTKLAALSQLVLLGPRECEDETDAIVDIAVNGVLLQPHSTSEEAEQEWMEVPDEDMVGRTWALKILVNRLRSLPSEQNADEVAAPVYKVLNRMVKEGGEASKKSRTPPAHKNLQRLLSASLLLKLSTVNRDDKLKYDRFLTPKDFNELALVAQDPCIQVRKGFASKLMKYLGQGRLPSRFYTILFLYAFEPDQNLKEAVTTWVRSRRAAFAARKETTLETIFARLLSVLAHHPDFATDDESLALTAQYIVFYLKCVATHDNLSLIYHVAQRVKGVADGINHTSEADEYLYALSDLSQAVIRSWEEQNGWTLQSWPGKLKLPAGIFRPLESHERAQEVADKVWINDDLTDQIDPLVRAALKGRKRKAGDGAQRPRKKTKSEKTVHRGESKNERPTKTPRSKNRRSVGSDDGEDEGMGAKVAPSSEPQRKSGRKSGGTKNYHEVSSDEEENAQEGDAEAGAQEEVDHDEETPEPNEDVEMVESEQAEEQEEDEEEEEPEPEPTPQKSTRKSRADTVKGVKTSQKAKEVEPLPTTLPARGTRGKAKVNGETSSSPVVNGGVRRSGRSRG